MQKALDRLALIISALASPFLVITAFGLWVIIEHARNPLDFLILGGTFFILIICLPMFYILYGVKTKTITDLHVMLKEQRGTPFLIAVAGAALLTVAYVIEGAPRPVFGMAVAVFVNGIVFLLITNSWKISIHAASFAGSVLIAACLVHPSIAFLFLLLPVITWARIRRQRHDLSQAAVAILIMLVVTFLTFKLLALV